MVRNTINRSKARQIADMGQIGPSGAVDVKALYLDWVRFFRRNMKCDWQCSGNCPLPDDCKEIDRVWLLWLNTLDLDKRALVT